MDTTTVTLDDINKRLTAEMQHLYSENAILKDSFMTLNKEVHHNMAAMKELIDKLMEMMVSNNISSKAPTIRKPKPASDTGATTIPVVPMSQSAHLTQVAQGSQSLSSAQSPLNQTSASTVAAPTSKVAKAPTPAPAPPGQAQVSLEMFFKTGIMDKIPEIISTVTDEDVGAVVGGDYTINRLDEKQLYTLAERLWPIVKADPGRKEALLAIKNTPKPQ